MPRAARLRALLALITPTLALTIAPTLTAPGARATDPPATVARLRLEAGDGQYLAWADNLLAGPIEVRLDAAGAPPASSQPPLPARASVAPGASTLLAYLRPPPGSGQLHLRLTATPGSSNARPRDVAYLLPLALPTARIDQGFAGAFSHQDAENRYALDLAAPEGTPVLAARAGVVMQVQTGMPEASPAQTTDALKRANFIRILHADGSMGLYAHLSAVEVRPGQSVQTGDRIGLSGNTGYSTGPHLHFAVQVNRGMQLISIPFRLAGPTSAAPPESH